jgi:hypothetical protein
MQLDRSWQVIVVSAICVSALVLPVAFSGPCKSDESVGVCFREWSGSFGVLLATVLVGILAVVIAKDQFFHILNKHQNEIAHRRKKIYGICQDLRLYVSPALFLVDFIADEKGVLRDGTEKFFYGTLDHEIGKNIEKVRSHLAALREVEMSDAMFTDLLLTRELFERIWNALHFGEKNGDGDYVLHASITVIGWLRALDQSLTRIEIGTGLSASTAGHDATTAGQ